MRWRRRRHTSKYERVLSSARWERLRQRRLRKARWRCESCRCRMPLQCHHLTYKRLGRERLRDVRMLCPGCHRVADRKRRAGL